MKPEDGKDKIPAVSTDAAGDVKRPMTEEERLELAKKLDEELDDFINGLEKKTYTDGWSEDTWEEEMDKHPFFMKSVPDSPNQMSPLVEGLAKLKYDPEENTPLELATSYKEDGNFHFKHKNYRMAIIAYTEGIKQKCDSADLNATLYQNRATAHFHLQNYRSALLDSEKALKFAPDYYKAQYRAAKSAFSCTKYDLCMKYCEKILTNKPQDKDVMELLAKAQQKIVIQERDERRKKKLGALQSEQENLIVNAVKERGIRVYEWVKEGIQDISGLKTLTANTISDEMVHIQDGVLRWPVLLIYPEYKITDYIKSFAENVTLMSEIQNVFPTPWDEENKYNIGSINVYYEGYNTKLFPVDTNKLLGDVMEEKYFQVKLGVASFIILARGSDAERMFLKGY